MFSAIVRIPGGLLLGVVVLATGCTGPLGREGQPLRPNVVLIMADDLGSECLACYGGESYATPHLDALAASGMRFTHCYSQPLCTPSRVKLMTGRSNVRNYHHFGILDPDEVTFGTLMKDAGYRTAVVGKWQLYGTPRYGELAGTGTSPAAAGFERSCLWQVGRLGSRYWNPRLDVDGEERPDLEGRYGPDVMVEFAERFLEEHRTEPFFLYYPMVLVHDPFVPPPGAGESSAPRDPRHFQAMVEHMDSIVGRLVAKLEELGLRERTLILFTSDNGTHSSIRSRRRGATVVGGKGEPTDPGMRVPLIASWPGVVPPAVTCPDLVDLSDFVPSLGELAGFRAPPGSGWDGRSFLPQLQGRPGPAREWIFCYSNPRPGKPGWEARRFAFDQRYKLYETGEFHDRAASPHDQQPLAAEAMDAAAWEARRALQAVLDRFPRSPPWIAPEPLPGPCTR